MSQLLTCSPRPLRARWRRATVSTWEEAAALVEAVAALLRAAEFPRQDVFAIRLALDEALANALKHGHRGDTTKKVRVRWRLRAEGMVLWVRDEGPGFDPSHVPDPLDEQALGRDAGRGLLLMRSYMARVRYNRRGNAVLLYRARTPV